MKKRSLPLIIYVLRFYFNSIGLLFKKTSSKQLFNLFSRPQKKVIRNKERQILEQAESSAMQLKEGVSIRIYQWGEGGKLAMLFHGWESNAGSLGAFVEPLLDLGYKVVAFDAPAHGSSGGKKSNLLYFKSAAKQLVDKMEVPSLAIGHSLGANAIIMTAFEEKWKMEKLILISPLNRLMGVFEEYKSILKIPDSLFRQFIKNFSEITGYELSDFYFHDYGRKLDLDQVLIVHDKNDQVTPFLDSVNMNKQWGQSLLLPIEGSGHYKIVWSKEAIEKSLNFIKLK